MAQRKMGRPRQAAALWSSLRRKGNKIRERLNLGGIYTERDGTVWEGAGTLAGPCIRVCHWAAGVRTTEAIYTTIDSALEAEIYNP